jgi:putative transposase
MSNLRRYYAEGQLYFVTCVTYNRQPILVENIDLFWLAVDKFKGESPEFLMAWAILPDHFHMLLCPDRLNLSEFMQRTKLSFASNYRKRFGLKAGRTWQLRFWDHVIRDEADFKKRMDYIHDNPRKHGMTQTRESYPHSSLAKYLGDDGYQPDWEAVEGLDIEESSGE